MNIRSTRLQPLLYVVPVVLFLYGCTTNVSDVEVEFRVPVEVSDVVTDNIESVITATGTLRPTNLATVRNEVPGFLYLSRDAEGRRLFEGSLVTRGQSIGETTGEDARLHANIESNRLAMETAQAELNRRRTMFEHQMISEADLRSQELAYENALHQYQQSIRRAEKTKHVAPIDGVILTLARDANQMPVPEGQLVAPSFVVAEIAPVAQLIADVNLVGPELSKVKVGQQTRIRHYAYDDMSFTGQVRHLSPKLDANTHTFGIEVLVDNSSGKLLPGMFVEVEVVIEERLDVTVVARNAVTRRRGSSVVFVLDGQRASMRTVQIGLGNDELVQVINGVAVGERIINRGLETLSDGTRVRVVGS